MFTRWPLYERILANLTDGSAISGLLVDKRGTLLVLSDCTLYTPQTEPQNMDGEIFIERNKVLFLQVAQAKGG